MSEEHKCQCNEAEEALYDELRQTLLDLKTKPGALIPMLQTTQNLFGYIPRQAILMIHEITNEPLSKIYGVITFYSYFSLSPRGKYLIRVCMGTACYVGGSENVLTALKQQLGVEVGETSDDSLFSLEVGRCFGACGLAPVKMVNDDIHQWVKPSDVERILRSYRKQDLETKSDAK